MQPEGARGDNRLSSKDNVQRLREIDLTGGRKVRCNSMNLSAISRKLLILEKNSSDSRTKVYDIDFAFNILKLFTKANMF